MTEPARIPLHFAVPVWGPSYVKTFCDYSVPSQISAGNLGSVSSTAAYTIYTTEQDAAPLSPAIEALSSFADVRLELIAPSDNKYDLKSSCYRDALQRAVAAGAALFLLNADIILADGFVQSVERMLAGGARVLLIAGPRALLRPMCDALEQFRDGRSIRIGPADLSRLWLRNIHPLLRMHFVDGEGEAFHPSHLYWRAGDEAVIARCFHLYPIVVRPRAAVKFAGTIDDDLAGNLGCADSEMVFATDSRELFACELSPEEHYVGTITTRGNQKAVVEFYRRHARRNLDYLRHEMIITGAERLGLRGHYARLRSALYVRSIFRDYFARGETT
ncbi:MAG TPA: hypothetical protein VKY65_04140 [Alphaproteobacteria bacterium]|nr:hypothetical protein [Alphaproteobacteria bacterium]